MKLNKTVLVVGAIMALVLVGSVLFGISKTKDNYECSKCKTIGESDAIRLFSLPIWKNGFTIKGSLTSKACNHEWRRWSANSQGLLFNRQNWDGCFGTPPWFDELEKNLGATNSPPIQKTVTNETIAGIGL